MKCGGMISVSGRVVPCGQCMACRINHKRLIMGRIVLEQAHTPTPSSFVTLTYEKEPEGGTLVPADLMGYLDRIRHRSGIGHVRYMAVGEYGDDTWRPHYHVILFGVPYWGFDKHIRECWKDGFVKTADLNYSRAAYIAAYCTKKMTSKEDSRLDGREPEFSRMSRNPPLGAAGINHIERLLQTKAGCTALGMHEDIPSTFRIQGKEFPLGRYWRNKLRERFGITNPPVNSEWQLDYEQFTKEQERAEKISIRLWRQKGKNFSRTL